MPRINGVMQPIPGSYGVPDTPIESAKYNAQLDDLIADANNARPVTAGGMGSQTAVGGSDNLSTIGTDVPSSATTNLAAANGANITITGTTTITGFGTAQAGAKRWITFAAVLTLTYNATKLILPGASNITTAAGDTCVALSLGSGNWRVVSYQRANGLTVTSGPGSGLDADKLDGQHASAFVLNNGSAWTPGAFDTRSANAENKVFTLGSFATSLTTAEWMNFNTSQTKFWFAKPVYVTGDIYAGPSFDKKVWHAGNVGPGSGLDSDLLDGQHGSYYLNAANMTGTFTGSVAGNVTGNLTGNVTGGVVTGNAATSGGWGVRGNSNNASAYGILGYQDRYSFLGKGEIANDGPIGGTAFTGTDFNGNQFISALGSFTGTSASGLVVGNRAVNSIYLRPLYNTSAGQTLIDASGNMTVAGSITAASNVFGLGFVSSTGSYISTSGNMVAGSGTSGTIFLRPNYASADGQTTISPQGNMTAAGWMACTGSMWPGNGSTELKSNGDIASSFWGSTLSAYIASVTGPKTLGTVASYAFAQLTGGSTVNSGGTTAGSNLAYAVATGASGGSPSGTWRNMGASVNANTGAVPLSTTLWHRIS